MGSSRGIVLQVQRMSTEDGPGLRSTAFLKGCPLRCRWCHNPESFSPRPEIQWVGSRCIGGPGRCGACLAACSRGALRRGAAGIEIDRGLCDGCGECAEACPGGAMELLGREMGAEELAAELLRDSSWYGRSDRGGVTLSGGEASMQADFAEEVLRLVASAGVHTALDTAGFAPWPALERLYRHTDLALYDLKEMDPGLHEEFTGAPNGRILENLDRTVRMMAREGRPRELWIRTPIVPGATDRAENLSGIGRFLASLGPEAVGRWELCAFNRLCADKYGRLGLQWEYEGAPLVARADLDALVEAARRGLGRGDIVSWTGSARLEPERN